MLSVWANWLVTKFGLNSLKRYLWPVLYVNNSCMYLHQIFFLILIFNFDLIEFHHTPSLQQMALILLTRSIRDSETSIDFVQGPSGSRKERVKFY